MICFQLGNPLFLKQRIQNVGRSKNWFWFALIGYVAECWATFGSFVMSETPKYLMKSGRKQEFLTLLNRIAKWNRTNNLADETFNDLDNFRVQA